MRPILRESQESGHFSSGTTILARPCAGKGGIGLQRPHERLVEALACIGRASRKGEEGFTCGRRQASQPAIGFAFEFALQIAVEAAFRSAGSGRPVWRPAGWRGPAS